MSDSAIANPQAPEPEAGKDKIIARSEKLFSDLNPKIKSAFSWAYWLSLSIVIVCIIALLLKNLFVGTVNYSNFIQSVALITLSMSVIFLAGDVVGLVSMPSTIRAAILTSFVVSVLGSSASVVSQAWILPSGASIRIVLLDENQVKYFAAQNIYCSNGHERRQTAEYTPLDSDNFGIYAAIIIKNIGNDGNGRPHVTGHFVLSTDSGLASYEKIIQSQEGVRSKDSWKENKSLCEKKNIEKITADIGIENDDLVLLRFFTKIHPAVRAAMFNSKKATLGLSLTDHVRGISAEYNPPTDIFIR